MEGQGGYLRSAGRRAVRLSASPEAFGSSLADVQFVPELEPTKHELCASQSEDDCHTTTPGINPCLDFNAAGYDATKAMCVECNYGPVGYQLADESRIWLCCDLLHQQDAALADDKADFSAPSGIDLGMLQGLIEGKMTFPELRKLIQGEMKRNPGIRSIQQQTLQDGPAHPTRQID